MVDDLDPSEASPPAEAAGPAPATRNRAILSAGIVVITVMALAGYLVFRGEDASAPATTTTTSTVAPETTTTKRAVPADTFEIATAKPTVSTLSVLADPPPDWASTDPGIVADGPPEPVASQDSAKDRKPLPSEKTPIQGRYAVDGGWEFSNPGPYDPPQPFTVLVVERRGDWLRVELPVRPNGTEGYVRTSDVELSSTQYRIEIRVGERSLKVFDGNTQMVDTPVVVGLPGSPTPTGLFYVTDKVPNDDPNGFLGPLALATNAYSETMDTFDTGMPVVALHGTNRPDLLGGAHSNGCVRLPNDLVQQVSDSIPLGAPVYIYP